MSNCELILGDCLEEMKEMPDNSVDLVLTDPPYGVEMKYDKYKDTEDNWFKLMENFIPEAKRVGKCVIFPSCQIKRLGWIYKNFEPNWLISWYKGSVGCVSMIGFNDWEPLLVYGKPQKQMHDFFKANPTPFDNGHPCPKSLIWAEWLISKSTNKGNVIFDPFMGSGTVGVATLKLQRRFIGIEISSNYFEIAKRRIGEWQNQSRLF